MTNSMLPQRRPLPSRLRSLRARPRLELLEARVLLNGDDRGLGLTLDPARPFTQTEVVAAFRSLGSAANVNMVLAQNASPALAGAIDWQTTRELLPMGNSVVMQIGLRSQADPLQVIQQLQALPFVEWASPNFVYDSPVSGDPREYTPNDPLYSQQYHHPLMRNNLAWDVTLGRSSVVVAVTDDGVWMNHVDLHQNIFIHAGEIPASRRDNLTDVDGDTRITFLDLNNPVNQGPFKITDLNGNGIIDPNDLLTAMVQVEGVDQGTGGWANGIDDDSNNFRDDLTGWDFSSNDNNANPVGGQDHGTHVAGIVAARTDNAVGVAGTAGFVTVMPIRFYGSGAWTSTVIANSYRYSVDNGAQIITTSYNVDQFVNDPTFIAGLQYVYSQGGLHFNSAGNNNQLNPPRANLDTSLYVVSTDELDRKSSFSNYGYSVDISAPGSNIRSTILNNNYGLKSGTSMSAPNAAAAAALIWSQNPTWTREQVVAQLIGTADNINGANPTYQNLLGSGRVNTFRAVSESLQAPRIKSVQVLPAPGGTTPTPITAFSIDVANIMDPATVVLSNFELRGAGADGTFDTEDDVLMPLSLPAGFTYRLGTNRLSFTVTSPMTIGQYRFRAISDGLRDPFGQALDGNSDGTGGDHFDRIFTFEPPTTISGLKFNDFNGNGLRDTGEPGLPGWEIFLDLNDNGSRDRGEPHRITDAAGSYIFDSLAPGTYIVREEDRPNWIQMTPGEGFHSVTISMFQTIANINFGNRRDVTPSLIVDDGDPGFTLMGTGWTTQSGAGSYQNDYRRRTAITSTTISANWLLPVEPGEHEVFVTWVAQAANTLTATYRISDGTTLLGAVVINQRVQPNEVRVGNVNWQSLGFFTSDSGSLQVQLLTSSGGAVIADGVFVAGAMTSPDPAPSPGGELGSDDPADPPRLGLDPGGEDVGLSLALPVGSPARPVGKAGPAGITNEPLAPARLDQYFAAGMTADVASALRFRAKPANSVLAPWSDPFTDPLA